MQDGLWLPRWRSETEAHWHFVKDIIYSGKSQYQKIDILLLEKYGKCLLLDGIHQSAEADEFIYHEGIVHPALFLHHNPKNVLIIGGGEGCVLREVLKHPSVENAVMVDIDGLVVQKCREYLGWEQGAYEDPRTKLLIEDGAQFIKQTDMMFDCIIVDSTTPKPDSIAFDLYGADFYDNVYQKLNSGGILAGLQSNANILYLNSHRTIRQTLQSKYGSALSYLVYCPFYAISYAFVLGVKDVIPNVFEMGRIKARVDKIRDKLKFYDEITHLHIFNYPKYMRDIIASASEPVPQEKLISH